jgi:hypothetical protein
MLLAVGAIFITIWLYAMRDANPYGGWTHIVLAAGLISFVLHILHHRRVKATLPSDSDVRIQRHASSLLSHFHAQASWNRVSSLMPNYRHLTTTKTPHDHISR